jgi:hypothetical protein
MHLINVASVGHVVVFLTVYCFTVLATDPQLAQYDIDSSTRYSSVATVTGCSETSASPIKMLDLIWDGGCISTSFSYLWLATDLICSKEEKQTEIMDQFLSALDHRTRDDDSSCPLSTQ